MSTLLITDEAIETGLALAEAKAHAAEVEARFGGFDPLAAMLGTQPAEMTEANMAVVDAMMAHDAAMEKQSKTFKVVGGTVVGIKKCERCSGAGSIPGYYYYCNGVCFGCRGSGTRYV